MSDRDRDTDRSFGLMDQHIALKADKDELLTSWGLRMLNNRFLRWGLGILFAAIVGTATFEHWWAWAFHR